jgi:putative endonuclease
VERESIGPPDHLAMAADPVPDTARAGRSAEDNVATRLAASGWTVVARNVRAGHGELDIVAVDPGPPRMLVIVEVRWRRRRDFGLPEETFGWRKRARLMRTIGRFLAAGALPDGRPIPRLPLRVDLVVVEPPLADTAARPRIRHHRSVLGT